MTIFSYVLLASLLHTSTSFEVFQLRIPNGNRVPFSCKPGEYWRGVGHLNPDGTGTRNPFGRDFENAGYKWTVDLCRKDSDGDGIYNGLELGDPNCVWTEGSTAMTMEGLSHPGICDPFDSMECYAKAILSPKYKSQQEWIKEVCTSSGFDCPAMNDKKLMNATIRSPPGTEIPPQVTTYGCQVFSLADAGVPMDQDFHMIAVTPLIEKPDLVHHIVLFGCLDSAAATSKNTLCMMKPDDRCQEVLHVWTVGLSGECYHPQSGVRLGKGGYKFVALQFHWTNPYEKTGLTDTSGLYLHYTTTMKQFDAGVFVVGSTLFYLPPNQQRVMVNSTCGSGCTQVLVKGSIYITAAWNHMHHAGKTMMIEVKRNNEHIAYLTMDRSYNYDSPQVMLFSDPVEIQQGDVLITQCGFNTRGKNRTIIWGDGTFDEMCFGFITYYPKQNLLSPFCVDKLGVSPCDMASFGGCANLGKFLKMITVTEAYKEVTETCMMFNPCLLECVDTIMRQMKAEPCLRGNIWEYIQSELTKIKEGPSFEFLARLASCKSEVQMAMTMEGKADNAGSVPSKSMSMGAGRGSSIASSFVVTIMSLCVFCYQFYII